MSIRSCLLCVLSLVCSASAQAEGVITFDDLTLSPNSYWNGPDPDGIQEPDPFGGSLPVTVGTFESGGARFSNRSNPNYSFDGVTNWGGFAYANIQDTTTKQYANQFASFAGSGAGPGADNFAVAFGYSNDLDPSDPGQLLDLPWLELPDGALPLSMLVTNTTLTALTMLEGDAFGFSGPFGGPNGTDPDWFKLTIYGTDTSGQAIGGPVEFFLADYRGDDDYVIQDWTEVDLSSLAGARRLHFNLSSSDSDPIFGMNTPGFFAVDDIRFATATVIPEPSSLVMLGLGIGAAIAIGKRRRLRSRC
jgi:hypothetical protein